MNVQEHTPPVNSMTPDEDQWEMAAVTDGLSGMIREYGASTVMAYVTGSAQSDRAGLGYLIERFGRDRIVRLVRNLAFIEGQAV